MSGNSFALISALFFLISVHSHAQNLDAASGQALKQTQSLLQNPSKREEFSKNSAKAKAGVFGVTVDELVFGEFDGSSNQKMFDFAYIQITFSTFFSVKPYVSGRRLTESGLHV